MVVGDVAHKLYRPAFVWLICKICLIIKEVRLVLSLRVQRTKQIAVGLVSQAVAPGELLCTEANIG